MEPGGIEPPSRDSRSAASTRVFGGLISAIRAGADALPFSHARGVFSPSRPRVSRDGQPDVFDPPLIGRQERIARPVLGRESVGSLNYCVACFLRGRHAPRRATANVPCPVESSSAPDCQRAGHCSTTAGAARIARHAGGAENEPRARFREIEPPQRSTATTEMRADHPACRDCFSTSRERSERSGAGMSEVMRASARGGRTLTQFGARIETRGMEGRGPRVVV